MKIRSNDIKTFVLNPPETIKLFLIYGPNYGLRSEVQKTLSNNFSKEIDDPFSTSKLESINFLNNQSLLNDEMNTLPMLQRYRLVFVKGKGTEMLKPVKNIINKLNSNSKIFLIADEINSKHQLVKLCENSDESASIGCYEDSKIAISEVINDIFIRENITISRDLKAYMISKLGNDRKITISEVEKISLFAKENHTLNYQEICDLLGENFSADIDNLLISVFCGDYETFYLNFHTLKLYGISSIQIIRRTSFIVKIIERLILLKRKENASNNLSTKYVPFMNFKLKNIIITKTTLWSSNFCRKIIKKLLDTEIKIKQSSYLNDYTITNKVLIDICLKSKI